MGLPSGPELMVILFIVILLFGAKKLPELAKGLGKGINEFKKASSGGYDDETTEKKVKKEEEE